MKTSYGLKSGDRAGHALSPMTLTFCYISYSAVTHKEGVSGNMFCEYFYEFCQLEHTIQFCRNYLKYPVYRHQASNRDTKMYKVTLFAVHEDNQ